jgi:glutathione S-transferase/translation elongation factor EF-1beta
MPCKLYAWTNQHFFLYVAQMAAAAAGITVETIIVPKDSEMAKDPAFIAKKAHGAFPMLETEDGKIIFESVAIAAYFCRQGAPDMMGKNAFAAASVNQWCSFATCSLDSILRGIVYNVFGFADNAALYDDSISKLGPHLAMINKHLAGKEWFAGASMTLADIVMFGALSVIMTFAVGAEQQKLIPNVCAWYNRMRVVESVVETVGLYKLAVEPFAIAGAVVKLNCAPVAVASAAADEEEDMDDLFGDDVEETEEQMLERKDHEAMLRGKAFTAKKLAAAEAAGKAPMIAKSLVLWEVKPVDDETDLQVLGKRIIAEIQQDGLYWKTEFKTVPIAYGIEKIIIGATIEDAKVSTDDVQEKIEAMEDMVQSVDIQSFNKL